MPSSGISDPFPMSRSTVFSSAALSSSLVLFSSEKSIFIAETSELVTLSDSSDVLPSSTLDFLAFGLSPSAPLGRFADRGESIFFFNGLEVFAFVTPLAAAVLRGVVRVVSVGFGLDGVVGVVVAVGFALVADRGVVVADRGVVVLAAACLGAVRVPVVVLIVDGVVLVVVEGDAFAEVGRVLVATFGVVDTGFFIGLAAPGDFVVAACFAAAALGDAEAAVVLVLLAVVTPWVFVVAVGRPTAVGLVAPADFGVVAVDGFVPAVPVDGLLVVVFFATGAVFLAAVAEAATFSLACFFFSSSSFLLSAAASFFCCSLAFLSSILFFLSSSCCSLSFLAFSIFSFTASPLAAEPFLLAAAGLVAPVEVLVFAVAVELPGFLVPAVPATA